MLLILTFSGLRAEPHPVLIILSCRTKQRHLGVTEAPSRNPLRHNRGAPLFALGHAVHHLYLSTARQPGYLPDTQRRLAELTLGGELARIYYDEKCIQCMLIVL